jgi:peptidoglycan/xylan/chitin deacetylase (PgdA/CDA1 family)
VQDVDKGAKAVEQITGSKPHYVRPPEWVMWPELRGRLEGRGYKVLTIYASDPALMRDVNSGDYLCAGKATQCPKPSLSESVMHQIESREKHGLYDHVLVFHELTSTVPQLETLIPELQKKGYKFVTLQQYMKSVASSQ